MAWKKLGSGCDKAFYIEQSGNGGYGAIICNDRVAARETKAYINLKTAGVTLLPTILPWTDREGIDTRDGVVKPQYQIERLHIDMTFKPQMCAIAVLGKVRAALKGGNAERLRAGFAELESKLELICGIVGELTLAVDKLNGRLYMLDFGPAENGDRAINQIETIRKGLRNLSAAVA
jgi:hypothetical protein